MIVQNIIERIHETNNKGNNDITLQNNNGQVHTNKLFLASWSKFWKDILLGFDTSEDIVIVIDVSKSVLNKLSKFLSTGKVNISGAQENIEVIEGLEMLLPDLDFSDQQKLVIEDAIVMDKETDMDTDCDKFKFSVTENFICNICLRYFSSKQKRDNHIENIHSQKKRYSCKVCAKIILSKDGLVSHMKTHTCSSHHQCPDCKKVFNHKSNLSRHLKSTGHSKSDKHETVEKCSECDFTTNRVDNLYRHERNIHGLYNKKLDAISKTLEKKGEVKCSKCPKKFTDTKLAKEHFLQESCDPIKCKDCGKEFMKRADLKLHIRDVHTKNNFPCPTCDKEFKQIRNMNRHYKKCKPKEIDNNEQIRKEVNHENSTKNEKINRNKRKQLSKTNTTKKLTENKTKDVIKNKDANKIITKSKTFVQIQRSKQETDKSKIILEQSIENCLKSIDMTEDDDVAEENDGSDEGDFL